MTGANGSSSPSIGRRAQDPGPQDLLHTNLNPGTYGHKISSEKTLRQWNSICTAGTGQKEARGQDRLGNMASTRYYLFLSDGKDVGLRFKAWKSEFGALKRLRGRL